MQLTPAQTAALTLELDKRDRQIRDDLRSLLMQSGNERCTDLVGAVHDPGDESVADMLSDLNNTLVARHVQELRELEAARKRLSDGTINECIDCGLEIGYKRLLAYPTAVRCIECQAQFEKTHQHAGTPSL